MTAIIQPRILAMVDRRNTPPLVALPNQERPHRELYRIVVPLQRETNGDLLIVVEKQSTDSLGAERWDEVEDESEERFILERAVCELVATSTELAASMAAAPLTPREQEALAVWQRVKGGAK